MRSKKHKTKWLSLLSLSASILVTLLLSSCDKLGIRVTIPAVEWCSSAGKFGALCQDSIDKTKRRQITIDEWIGFLSARPASPGVEAKGPALCTASNDFAKVQTALEQLCYKAGKYCTLEQKKLIDDLKSSATLLATDAQKKANETR